MLPRRAGWRRQLEFEKNELRALKTMECFRYGFRLWWRGCPKYLRQIGMGKVGSFCKSNHHHGEMFSLPGEFSLTKEQAAKVLFKCYKSKKFTYSQMRTIKKTLSYAYQLQGGIPGKNFETIPGVWLIVREEGGTTKPQEHFCLPTRVPLPAELKKAFTTEYREECGWCYVDWNRGLLETWDWGVLGTRSVEGMKRIKTGKQHGIDHREGWGWTALNGGRPKLCVARKGIRQWRVWRVCMCIGGKHIPLPQDAEYTIDKKGNLMEPPNWCTCCPVNAMELQFRLQDHLEGERHDDSYSHVRVYRKWDKTRRRAAKDSQGDPVDHALKWLKCQGIERDFDTNAGRKALSRWLRELNILHEESVQIHGDLEEVWEKSYQKGLPKTGSKVRNQSDEPDVACSALRKWARFCNRGLAVPAAVLSTTDEMLIAVLESLGKGERARQILNRGQFPKKEEEDPKKEEDF